jgi:hypothetical protein
MRTPKKKRWLALKWTSWILVWPLWISGCGEIKPYFCKADVAYNEKGEIDTASYRVDQACLKGLSARVKACYKEAQ